MNTYHFSVYTAEGLCQEMHMPWASLLCKTCTHKALGFVNLDQEQRYTWLWSVNIYGVPTTVNQGLNTKQEDSGHCCLGVNRPERSRCWLHSLAEHKTHTETHGMVVPERFSEEHLFRAPGEGSLGSEDWVQTEISWRWVGRDMGVL